jgi:hypothetical protein
MPLKVLSAYDRAGEHFCGRVPKLSINFEGILSHVHGNSEEQNKVSESSMIIIKYCIIITIIIIAYYNYLA